MSHELDGLEAESALLGEARERDFEEWVRGRLSGWSIAEIRALDGWFVEESQLEFVPAVRGAWMRKSLDELDRASSQEPAA